MTRKPVKHEFQKPQEILDSVSDGFLSLDRRFNVTYLNKEAEQLFMLSRETMIGRNFFAVRPQAVGSKLHEMLVTAMNSTGTTTFNHRGILTGKFYEVKAYPSDNGLFLYFQDVTEQEKTKEEITKLERLNLIGQMAAGIGHEVRNPLTTVRGFLQLFLTKNQYVTDRSYFELMIQEIDRANFILTELLSLGKNRVEDSKKLNLNDVLQEIYPLLLSDAINSNKELNLKLGKVSDLLINEKEVRQLIFNLFRNGLEAMDSGGKITIKTFVEDDRVVLAVIDEGCGINKDTQKKIGTPFFTTKDKGTGLGLAVCNSIVDRNNATMNFTTGPEGTTFFVRFKKLQVSRIG